MKKAVIIFALLCFIETASAKNLGTGTTPKASAQLDVTKGFLPSGITSVQRDTIESSAAGLVIFNATTNSLQLYTGSACVSLTTSLVFLPAIVVGAPQWMAKNLDVAFYRNGDPIPQVTDPTAWAYLTTGAWCYYNNDSTQGKTYGKLYNWYAVNDPRGLAPAGWHIPGDTEWTALENSLGGSSVAGAKMKEAGILHWTSPNSGANNNSGWTGLPGGCRIVNGFFSSIGDNGYWWSSWESNTELAVIRILAYTGGSISKSYAYKYYGYSVRCIRD